MTDWYKVFYWLTVADNAKTFFMTFVVIFTAVSAISTFCYLANMDDTNDNRESQAMARKWMWWSYPFMILFWSLYVFTPSKRDALIIIAGGTVGNFVTRDSSTRAIPAEAMQLLRARIKEEIADASLDQFLDNDTLKNKTKEELIEILKKK